MMDECLPCYDCPLYGAPCVRLTVSIASDIEVLNHDDVTGKTAKAEMEQEKDVGVCQYFQQVLEQPSSAWLTTG